MNLLDMIAKMRSLLLVLTLIGLTSCKTGQLNNTSGLEIGTIKVVILYPNGEDATFDMDYYEEKHMPMVAGFIGDNLKFYEIDKGLAGRTPEDKVPFVAIGYFYVSDLAQYNEAIGQNIDAILGDFKNYTNIRPVVQISEIKQVRPADLK